MLRLYLPYLANEGDRHVQIRVENSLITFLVCNMSQYVLGIIGIQTILVNSRH